MRRGYFLGYDESHVYLSTAEMELEIERTDGRRDPTPALDALLDGEHTQLPWDLEIGRERFGVLFSEVVGEHLPAKRTTTTSVLARPLIDLVTLALAQHPALTRLGFTAEEALCLPDNLTAEQLRTILRIFLGNLSPSGRANAYGYSVATGTATVLRDEPSEGTLQSWLEAHHPAEPHVHDLAGRIDAGSPVIRGGEQSRTGRLEIVQTLLVQPCLDGWWLEGRATWTSPNLRSKSSRAERVAGAIADTAEDAAWIAVAEATERFAAGDSKEKRLVRASANELKGDWLAPDSVVAYSDTQYLRQPQLATFNPENTHSWVQGAALDRRPVWVLADLVYYPFRDDTSALPYTFASSSGVAAGRSYEEARDRAQLELIERDRFMYTWISGTSPPRI